MHELPSVLHPTVGEGGQQKAAKESLIEEIQVELSTYIVTEAEHS